MNKPAFFEALESASRTIAWPLIELHIERLTGQRDLDRVPSSRYAEIIAALQPARPPQQTKAEKARAYWERNKDRRNAIRRKRRTVAQMAEDRRLQRERKRHAKP